MKIKEITHKEFGHKKLMHKSTKEQIEMLKVDSEIDWNDYKPANKIGTYVQREQYDSSVYHPKFDMDIECVRSRVVNLEIETAPLFNDLFKVVFGENNVN